MTDVKPLENLMEEAQYFQRYKKLQLLMHQKHASSLAASSQETIPELLVFPTP